ncbi:MAG: restriction endonuclease [Lentisphaerae bacterium]|nr:restriction endonuclease [Lentisphaerota bacterium]
MTDLNKNITILSPNEKKHTKASERYVHVRFDYEKEKMHWEGWIPIEYRRTGVHIEFSNKKSLYAYLNRIYIEMNPQKYSEWEKSQNEFWNQEKNKANITKTFFDGLKDCQWKCRTCELPENPNFARRIQDLKEFGYTIATDTKRFCPKCNKNNTHLLLLPIKRYGIAGNGYETWSSKLRNKILQVLQNIDVYENRHSTNLLPDHKFPEIRWDEQTKVDNSNDMTDSEIKSKFQLLTNQRNLQKREVCRECFQSGKRGNLFGIKYYYAGEEQWNKNIPSKGKCAEQGCVGCPWYDIAAWRNSLNEKLKNK